MKRFYPLYCLIGLILTASSTPAHTPTTSPARSASAAPSPSSPESRPVAALRPSGQPPAADLSSGNLPPISLASSLQEVSVTIKSARGEGSGVVTTRNGINYIWTAAHVVAANRSERSVIDPATGTKRIIVDFTDLSVIQSLYEDGRKVGQLEMLAKVIRYSNANHGEDLALLQIRKKNFITSSARFYLDSRTPPAGTDLLHVGSLLGQSGSNSLTDGILSQTGRLHNGKVYDQTTVTAFPGSSGGGVYLKSDGRYVGMIVRGAGETFNLMVPVRRLVAWAHSAGIAFTLDPTIPIPTNLKNLPVEDTGHTFAPTPSSPTQGSPK